MSSVGPGIDLLSYVSSFAYQFGADRLAQSFLARPGAQWKQIEASLMGNASMLLILLAFALLCGGVIGAVLTHPLRKRGALASLAQAVNDALSAAEALMTPSTQDATPASSRVRQRSESSQMSVYNEAEHGKLKRLFSGLGRIWPWQQPHQVERTSVETLIQQVHSLTRILEQARRLKNDGSAPVKDSQPPMTSRKAPAQTRITEPLNHAHEPDRATRVDYNAGKRPEHRTQTHQPQSSAKAHMPSIVRRKDHPPTSKVDSAAEALIQLYNNAVDNRALRSEFRGRFQPLRIGTVNAPERRRDPNRPAEIREASDGNFFAIKNEAQGNYLVIPGFDMAVKHTSFEAGAIGEIFDCPGYNPDLSYLFVKVSRPAVFKVCGDNWELQDKGELDLGPGE